MEGLQVQQQNQGVVTPHQDSNKMYPEPEALEIEIVCMG